MGDPEFTQCSALFKDARKFVRSKLYFYLMKIMSYVIAFNLYRTCSSALLQLLALKRSGRAEEKQTNETGPASSEKIIKESLFCRKHNFPSTDIILLLSNSSVFSGVNPKRLWLDIMAIKPFFILTMTTSQPGLIFLSLGYFLSHVSFVCLNFPRKDKDFYQVPDMQYFIKDSR